MKALKVNFLLIYKLALETLLKESETLNLSKEFNDESI